MDNPWGFMVWPFDSENRNHTGFIGLWGGYEMSKRPIANAVIYHVLLAIVLCILFFIITAMDFALDNREWWWRWVSDGDYEEKSGGGVLYLFILVYIIWILYAAGKKDARL